MMKNSIIAALFVASLAAAPAFATQVKSVTVSDQNGVLKTTEILKSGKNLERVTCRDFNELQDNFKPEAVTYAANYGPKGKAHPVIDVVGVQQLLPVVVQRCNARPADKLVNSTHAAMQKKS